MRCWKQKVVILLVVLNIVTNPIFAQINSIPDYTFFMEGDLLFQDLDCGELCDAIEKVTRGKKQYNISHMGMIVKKGDSLFVEEAYGSKVRLTTTDEFLSRSKSRSGNPKVIWARVHTQYHNIAIQAASVAKKYIDTPYDELFTLGEDALYCSELIYYSFKQANSNKEFFPLHGMSFSDPETGTTFPIWNQYFKKLNSPVPESKPGCNPSDYSSSDKVNILFSFAEYEKTESHRTKQKQASITNTNQQ